MRLSELFKGFDVRNFKDCEVRGLAYDSRRVGEGFLFFAIRGYKDDGHRYIDDAVKKGAVALVVERSVETELPHIVVDRTRPVMSQLASKFFGDPSKHLRVVGITGTNGKTTTAFLLHHLLKTFGQRGGMIGTVHYDLVGRIEKAVRTTPESVDLQQMIAEVVDRGGHYLVMEVSSHGLEEDRVRDVQFDIGIFTNLAREHLDYHHTMEHYWRSKLKLFQSLRDPETIAIVNVDDPRGKEIHHHTDATITTYGMENPADVQGIIHEMSLDGTRVEILGLYRGELTIPLMGSHNVYNALAVLALASTLGIPWSCAKEAIETFNGVPGRVERIKPGSPVEVIVDYAHTPLAVKTLLSTLRPLVEGRLIVVFGAGGDRDRGKRSEMGHVVEEIADFAYITTDNPRSEDPEEIAMEIRQGMLKKTHKVVLDREMAIYEAIKEAQPGDLVAIIGKGHEDYQIIGNEVLPFSDREVALSALKRYWL
jgi:UDP-N-acetylmuramoyl-L-alanyl-D-glutamate--2,6-diaminopimelate ligase